MRKWPDVRVDTPSGSWLVRVMRGLELRQASTWQVTVVSYSNVKCWGPTIHFKWNLADLTVAPQSEGLSLGSFPIGSLW